MEQRIDVFCHILPKRYEEERWKSNEKTHFVEHSPSHLKYVRGGKAPITNYEILIDLDARFRMMDEFPGYKQVLSVASPPIEAVDPDNSEFLAKVLNDELAEIVQKHPDRFAGAVCSLPMNRPDAAAKELERSLKDLKLAGVQLFSNVLGEALDLPKFRPIFEIMAKHDKPILLHPARSRLHPDYLAEKTSRYIVWQVFGWPYESTAAMAHIALSGIFEELPDLRIVVHHTAAMVPFFSGRIAAMYRMFDPLLTDERGGKPMPKPVLDYFRKFYGDTSTFTAASIECASDFLGADHVLFGTDAPFDAEGGRASIRESTEAIEKARLGAEDRKNIFHGNFERLFRVSPVGAKS